MNSQWLWATIPVAGLCLPAVVLLIWDLVSQHRANHILSLPLLAEQTLSIDAAGTMLLHGEGPRFSTTFAKLEYQLTELAHNANVPLAPIWFKFSSSGVSRSRLSLRGFEVEQPGNYRLKISGLENVTLEQHQLIVTRDHRARTAGMILALVFFGGGLIASLVLSFIAYFSAV